MLQAHSGMALNMKWFWPITNKLITAYALASAADHGLMETDTRDKHEHYTGTLLLEINGEDGEDK